jgi:hypothetical protein
MAGLASSADLADGKIKNLGRSLGLTAVAFTAFSAGSDILDSFGKSLDTVGQKAGGVEQLEQLFAKSNVGKYAADLGIDVGRLAQDLATAGREGEYYKEVAGKFGDASEGAGGKINSLIDTLTPFIGDTEKAGLAQSDFGRILSNNEQLLGSVAAEAAAASQAEIEGMTNAMREQVNAAVGAFDAVTQYRQALKDARAQAEKTDAGIRGNSDAALANRGALSALAAAWNNQSDAAKNTPGAYAAARRAFVETANAMGVPIGKAKELFNQLNEIPPRKVTTVTAETGQASAALNAIRGLLFGINSKTVTLTTVRRTVNEGQPSGLGPRLSADGGSVPKDGGVYADRFAYMLAPGEEIISNRYGQADRFRADRAAGRIPGYADGGTTGKSPNRPRYAWDDAPRNQFAGMSARELKVAEKQAEKALKVMQRGAERMQGAVDAASDAFDKVTQAAKDEASAREQLQSQFDSLSSGVGNRYMSDLFGSTGTSASDVFGNTSPNLNPIDRLLADLGAIGGDQGLFSSLQARGLSGASLTYAAQQEGGLSSLSSLSDSDLQRYSSLFAQREQAAAGFGNQVAQNQLGSALAASAVREAELIAQTAYQSTLLESVQAEMAALNARTAVQTQVVERTGNAQEQATKQQTQRTAQAARNRPKSKR